MKRVRIGVRNSERPGMTNAGGATGDLSGHISDITADNFTGDILSPSCRYPHHRAVPGRTCIRARANVIGNWAREFRPVPR